jgi:nucleoside-diphosphate-sugar epimerase
LHRIRSHQPIRIWGDGSATRDFIFIDDAARAIVGLVESNAWRETVNVGTGVGVSITSLLEAIAQVVPERIEIERQPGYTGPSVSVLDIGKLKTLTGFEPEYDLAAGVAEAWRRMTR